MGPPMPFVVRPPPCNAGELDANSLGVELQEWYLDIRSSGLPRSRAAQKRRRTEVAAS
jgi:hypothetical protein